MPELVEVEVTKRNLIEKILSRRIIKTEVYLDKIVYNKKDEFINETINKNIINVKRRGKYLLFELEDSYIVIHFRMEGRFYLLDKDALVSKHDYVIFYFEDFSLHYNDPRLFGKMQIVKKDKIDEFFLSKKIGLEYFDPNLTGKYLKDKFKTHHVFIKNILLNQSIIAGIGNIYANEILFLSSINPKSYADKIPLKKLDEIIINTKKVFEESIECNGTYPNIDGNPGTYEKYLRVYKRKDKKCYVCNSLIVKEETLKRGTYYCPYCQKKIYK